MSLSLKQEKEKQAHKDMQVLAILKQKDKELIGLNSQVEQLQQENATLGLKLEAATIEAKEAKEKLTSALAELKKLQEENLESINPLKSVDVSSTVETLKFQLAQAKNKAEGLAGQNQKLQAALETLEKAKTLEAEKGKVTESAAEHQAKQLKIQVSQLTRKLENKEEQARKLGAECESARRDLLNTKAKFMERLKQVEQDDQKVIENKILVEELERVEEEKDRLQSKLKDINTEHQAQVNGLQKKLEQSFDDIKKMAEAQNQSQAAKKLLMTKEVQTEFVDFPLFHPEATSQSQVDRMLAGSSEFYSKASHLKEANKLGDNNSSSFIDEKYLGSFQNQKPPGLQPENFVVMSHSSASHPLAPVSDFQNPSSPIGQGKDPAGKGLGAQQLQLTRDLQAQLEGKSLEIKRLELELAALKEKQKEEEPAPFNQGMLQEELVKMNEFLKKENQQLRQKQQTLFGEIPTEESPWKGATQHSYQDTFVFNPYKTGGAPLADDASKKGTKAFETTQLLSLQEMKSSTELVLFVDHLQEQLSQARLALEGATLPEDSSPLIAQLRSQLESRDGLILQLKEQLLGQETAFRSEVERIFVEVRGPVKVIDFEAQNSTKELTLALQKLLVQVEALGLNSSTASIAEALSKQQAALSASSKTIFTLQKQLHEQQTAVTTEAQFMNAVQVNKVLSQRQAFLIAHITTLAKRLQSRDSTIQQQRQQFDKALRSSGQTEKIGELKSQINRIEMEQSDLISHLVKEKNLLQDRLNAAVEGQKYFQESIELRVASEYDQRQKLRDEKIKSYFDSQVMKHLAASGSKDEERDQLELTRQFCGMQLELDQKQKQIGQLTAEVQGYAEQVKQQQEVITSLRLKEGDHLGDRSNRQAAALEECLHSFKIESELISDLKQQAWQSEQEVVSLRRERTASREQASDARFSEVYKEFEQALSRLMQSAMKEVSLEQIENLQQQMFDLRAQQLMEIEEIKTNCELELMEEKQKIAKEKKQLEDQFKLSGAAGEGRTLSEVLLEKQKQESLIDEQKQQIQILRTELAIVERKLENERVKQYDLQDEIRVLKETLREVANDIVDKDFDYNRQQSQHSMLDDFTEDGKKQAKTSSSLKKGGAIGPTKASSKSSSSRPACETSFLNATTVRGGNQLTFNPPALVHMLVEAKLSNNRLLAEVEKCKRHEADARVEMRRVLTEKRECQSGEDQASLLSRHVSEERIRANDLLAKVRELEVQLLTQETKLKPAGSASGYSQPRGVPQSSDYQVLVNTIINLILEGDEALMSSEQDRALRLVIVQLTRKIQALTKGEAGVSEIDRFIPSGEKNQKIWHLELLETQLSQADTMITHLVDFVKRIQIEITGNLTSAAQIKATSLELAQTTKDVTEEIKMLKHVCCLLRSDIDLGQPKSWSDFSKGADPDLHAQAINLLDLQSQLEVTRKVKESVEKELGDMKQTLFTSKNEYRQEIGSLKQKNQQLELEKASLNEERKTLSEAKADLSSKLARLESEHKQMASEAVEEIQVTKKEKTAIAKNQSITSKNLSKLQTEMREWRKTTDENLRLKEDKLKETQKKLKQLEKDHSKIKAENQMLRRNQKEWLGSNTKLLEEENAQIRSEIEDLTSQREHESDAWEEERRQLHLQIFQLQEELAERKGEGLLAQAAEEEPKGDAEKSVDWAAKFKKLKAQAEQKIKLLKQKEKYLTDEVEKLEMHNTRLTEKNDSQQKELSELNSKLVLQSKEAVHLQREKDMILVEQRSQLKSTDLNSHHIQAELDRLRESFSRVKSEKDTLAVELSKSKQCEAQWKEMVDKLKVEIDSMTTKVGLFKAEEQRKVDELQAKDETRVVEINILQKENAALREDNSTLFQRIAEHEQSLSEKEQEIQARTFEKASMQKRVNDAAERERVAAAEASEIRAVLEEREAAYSQNLHEMESLLDEVKQQKQSLIAISDNQLDLMKQRLASNSSETTAEMQFAVTQKEASIKALKKELASSRQLVQKLKTQKQDLKTALGAAKEKAVHGGHEGQALGFMALLDKANSASEAQRKILELQARLQKSDTMIEGLNRQVIDREQALIECQGQLQDLAAKEAQDSKLQKVVGHQTETIKALKHELRLAKDQLSVMHNEWVPPSKQKQDLAHLKDVQSSLKSVKEELARKKELIATLRQAKESNEQQSRDATNELSILKDENTKLSKQVKQGSSTVAAFRSAKAELETYKASVHDLRSELAVLQERLKSSKADIARKDQIIFNLKASAASASAQNQTEISIRTHSKERKEQSTILKDEGAEEFKRKQKDLKQKHKLEIQIKENHVRSLKMKIEQQEDQIASLRQDLEAAGKQVDLPLQVKALEKQHKRDKNKLKKYDQVVKDSLGALQILGEQLQQQSQIQPVTSRTHNTLQPSSSYNSLKSSTKDSKPKMTMEPPMPQYHRDGSAANISQPSPIHPSNMTQMTQPSPIYEPKYTQQQHPYHRAREAPAEEHKDAMDILGINAEEFAEFMAAEKE